MELIKKISDCLHLGFQVKFSSVGFYFTITVLKEINNKQYISESQMPFDHHFNELRIADCIDFEMDIIEQQISEIK